MPKSLIVHTLIEKRAEILGQIKAYEAQIAHAKHDLAHVNATIELFAEPERQRARYIVSHGFFKKGEIADICVRHLGVDGVSIPEQKGKNCRPRSHSEHHECNISLSGTGVILPHSDWFQVD